MQWTSGYSQRERTKCGQCVHLPNGTPCFQVHHTTFQYWVHSRTTMNAAKRTKYRIANRQTMHKNKFLTPCGSEDSQHKTLNLTEQHIQRGTANYRLSEIWIKVKMSERWRYELPQTTNEPPVQRSPVPTATAIIPLSVLAAVAESRCVVDETLVGGLTNNWVVSVDGSFSSPNRESAFVSIWNVSIDRAIEVERKSVYKFPKNCIQPFNKLKLFFQQSISRSCRACCDNSRWHAFSRPQVAQRQKIPLKFVYQHSM